MKVSKTVRAEPVEVSEVPGPSNVEAGMDNGIKGFYHRSHTAAVLGDQEFITWVRESHLREVTDKVAGAQVLPGTLSIAHIIRLVAGYTTPLGQRH